MGLPIVAAESRSATIRITEGARRALTRERAAAAAVRRRIHMLFIVIGVVLIVLNLARVGVVGTWTSDLSVGLWKSSFPFLRATIGWFWPDKAGLKKRREMDWREKKKDARRKKNPAGFGRDAPARRKANK